MTADYQLDITMEGTTDELKSMLGVVGLYTGEKPQSFSFIKVSGKEIDLKNLTDEIINEVSSSGKVTLTALGPWGSYGELNDVGLFREMAEAAPKAHFNAEISGSGTYEVQNLKCELKDGLLNITTYFESNEAAGEEYAEDFVKKLPYGKFKKLFKVSGEDFDKEAYRYMAENLIDVFRDSFEDADFDEFVEWLEDNEGETELDEDEFREIAGSKLEPLGIMTGDDFEESHECGATNEYVYDPLAKAYVGKKKPLFENGQITNANDLIAAGLKAQGLPSDEESVANLSIEDAYAALGAALGGDSEEDDDDDDDDDDDEFDEDEDE